MIPNTTQSILSLKLLGELCVLLSARSLSRRTFHAPDNVKTHDQIPQLWLFTASSNEFKDPRELAQRVQPRTLFGEGRKNYSVFWW